MASLSCLYATNKDCEDMDLLCVDCPCRYCSSAFCCQTSKNKCGVSELLIKIFKLSGGDVDERGKEGKSETRGIEGENI